MLLRKTRLAAFAGALCFIVDGPSVAGAGERLAGPVEVTVLRVIDGDTFVADAHVWPGETIRVSIRVRGIDAPELHSRCEAERAAAALARDALAEMIGGQPVTIFNIGGDKYFGRVLADVTTQRGELASGLLGRALVQHYDGGRRHPYCAGTFAKSTD